jgi:type II secretory pathway predicted ATPase ExeA
MNLHQLLERNDRPFLSHPQVGRYFPAASIEDARRRLARSIERGEGPGVVIGAAGTGKSLLLQVLAAQYHERFDVVLLACAQMHTRRGLLQVIHFELGLDHQQRDEGELRLSLLDHLLSTDQSPHGLLLLVDEAQLLPTQLLEEIRVIGNLARNGSPRVRVVLAGLPALEERLTSPELDSFNQRLASRCCLTPFSRAETAQYVQAQIAVCNADPQQIFAAGAWDALFDTTDGVPRLVNQLCDRAMLLADDRKLSRIDSSMVEAAWADLQQLPGLAAAASNVASRETDRPEVVEFGSLGGDSLPPMESASVAASSYEQFSRAVAADFAAPVVTRREPSVAPSERLEISPSTAQRRPRTFDDCVPEAVDPFADEFEEEEVLLDRFSLLSEMFHANTPRVSNRRDPAFARMVDQALECEFAASDDPQADLEEAPAPDARQASVADKSGHRGFGPGQPTIRLAIVDDGAATKSNSRAERHVIDVYATPLERPSPPTEITLNPPPAKSSPSVVSKFHLSLTSKALSRATDDPILVIEDEPVRVARAQPGVRREEYRDLFSRLRHGA